MHELLRKTVSVKVNDELWDDLTERELDDLAVELHERIESAVKAVHPVRAGVQVQIYWGPHDADMLRRATVLLEAAPKMLEALTDLVDQLRALGIPDWAGAEGLYLGDAEAAIREATTEGTQ